MSVPFLLYSLQAWRMPYRVGIFVLSFIAPSIPPFVTKRNTLLNTGVLSFTINHRQLWSSASSSSIELVVSVHLDTISESVLPQIIWAKLLKPYRFQPYSSV